MKNGSIKNNIDSTINVKKTYAIEKKIVSTKDNNNIINKSNNNVDVVTFGCRLNLYESQIIDSHVKKSGLKNSIIVNTCAVTSNAEKQGRKDIKKLKKLNPHKKIIVTGCAAQINPKQFEEMNEVDYVIGNNEKMQLSTFEKIAVNRHEKVKVNDIMEVKELAVHMAPSFNNHTRAFLQIQNGCNHRCTFCIIPYGRGNSRSVPVGEIVRQVSDLVKKGYKEIVLTGVDVSSYGENLPGKPSLGNMINRLFKHVPNLPRLRLSSIDCIEIDEELFKVIKNEKRFMPYLHLSLQSGDDIILKRMARRHNSNDIIKLCEKLRSIRPDIVFGADIIAGFPTETEEMFNNTLKLIEKCNITWIHAFPYSERNGTPAAKIPKKIPSHIRKERTKKLIKFSEKQINKYMNYEIGKIRSVIVEKNNIGRTEHFSTVKIKGENTPGELINVKIYEINNNTLMAKRV